MKKPGTGVSGNEKGGAPGGHRLIIGRLYINSMLFIDGLYRNKYSAYIFILFYAFYFHLKLFIF